VAAQTKKCQSKKNAGSGGCGDPRCPQGVAIREAFDYAIEHDDYSMYEQITQIEESHRKATQIDAFIEEVVAKTPQPVLEPQPVINKNLVTPTHSTFIDENEYDAWPIPQASDLEKVSSVVDAINNSATTAQSIAEALGTVDREGGYYANAAGYIGLIEKYEDDQNLTQYGLTMAGQTFVNLSPSERAVMLSEMIKETPIAQTYNESSSKEDFEKQLMGGGKNGLTDVTAKRRASSFESWTKQLGDVSNLSSTLEKQQVETISRSILASKNQQIAREARKEQLAASNGQLVGAVCPTCFIQMPVSGKCLNCD